MCTKYYNYICKLKRVNYNIPPPSPKKKSNNLGLPNCVCVCVCLQVRKEYGRCLRTHCCSGKSVESTVSTSTKTSTARTPGRYSTNSQVTHTHTCRGSSKTISSDFSRPMTGQCSHQLVISLHRKHFSSGVFLYMDEYHLTWPDFPFSLILNGALSSLLTSLFVNIIRKVFNAVFQLAISHSTVPITVDKEEKKNPTDRMSVLCVI